MLKSFICITLLSFGLFAEEYIANVKTSFSQRFSYELGIVDDYVLSIEPGISGTKLHAGFGELKGNVGGVWGHRVTLTYLHMNESRGSFEIDGNYVGVEALGMLMFGMVTIGILFDVKREAHFLVWVWVLGYSFLLSI